MRTCIRYLFLLLTIFGTLTFIWVAKLKMEQPASHQPLKEMDEEEPFDHFKLLGISRVSFKGNDKYLSMVADKIIHRNRRSEVFTYHNLKEIYISGLKIETYPEEQLLQEKSGPLNFAFNAIGKDIAGNILPTMGLPSILEGYPNNIDQEFSVLTRVVIERLFLTINLRKGGKVVITSGMAIINFHGVTFQGHFSLISSDGKTVTTSKAIWLKGSEGIIFPDDYILQANGINQRGTRAIFIVDGNGKLIKSTKQAPQSISTLDWFDEAEARFNSILLRTLFRYIPSYGAKFPKS